MASPAQTKTRFPYLFVSGLGAMILGVALLAHVTEIRNTDENLHLLDADYVSTAGYGEHMFAVILLAVGFGALVVRAIMNMTARRASELTAQVTSALERTGLPAASIAADAPSGMEPTEQLRKLADLRDQGVISEDEFQGKKAEILDRI